MATYESLPTQARLDVDECVNAFFYGGKKLGTRTFQAVAQARKMPRWAAVSLGDVIRARLVVLGYLPIR